MPTLRSPDLVGRDAELEELVSRLGIDASPAADGETPVVLLGGDAGVGKTRLLLELRDRALDAGWTVVAGHCLDLADASLPYLPFSEILGRFAAEEPALVEPIVESHPSLGRLLPGRRLRATPEAGAPTGDDRGALARGDIYEAVHALLERAAATAPLLVIVEDAHWADQSTRETLRFLFSRPFAGRVSLVVSYRADDLHRRHPLRRQVAEWARLRGVERLEVGPLSDAEVRRLVHQLHPDPIHESEMADLVARAEGNAFFVEELVGAMWASGGRLPGDLADVLLVRLDRLDDEARQVVRVASVAGRQVSHRLLAAVTGTEEAQLDAALRSAVDSNVLVPGHGDSYSFRHALLAEAVYDDLLPGERVRLHGAYARALAERAHSAAELARHARLAQQPRTSFFASIEAGDEAMQVGGPDEAAAHYQQALALLTDPGLGPVDDVDVPRLVTRTADALVASGHVTKAMAVVREQLRLLPADTPPADRGELLTALVDALQLVDSTEDPRPLADEAVALLADGTPLQRARALLGRARAQSYRDRDVARESALEALALAERHALPRLATEIRTALVGFDKHLGDITLAIGEVIDQARSSGAVEAEVRGRYILARHLQDRGDLEASVDAFAGAVARGVEAGTPWSPFVSEGRLLQAVSLQTLGRWDEALEILDVGGGRPPALFEAMYAAVQAGIRASRGEDVLAMTRLLRPFWDRDGLIAIGAATAELELHEQRADLAAARATYADVVEVVPRLWSGQFQARIRLSARVIAVASAAAPSMSAEERVRTDAVVRQLHDEGRVVVQTHREAGTEFGPESTAWAHHLESELLRWRWLAQVDPPAEGELVAAWRESERLFAELGHVHELARTRARLCAILRATGDTAAAREAGDLARVAARSLGAAPLLAEMTATGATPAREASSTTLTARESEILALVSEGRTNGEIGKQLFITTKTVSVHVSNILGKLGAASRTEAAAIARRRGLL